ncbi:MAG: alanine--glyoxylate aminotransferase family protein, partial [Synergistes sp.]|nr:alanine--glyoxylate aminotransferase family protein [Synergistes sp.]
GLGLLWLSDRALSELENRKCPSYYFDLKLHLKHMKQGNMANPYTPPVSLYYALDAALDVIVSAGCDKWFAKRRKYADAFAAGLEAMGYELFVKDKALRSAGLTAFSAPGGRSEDVRKKLSAAGFETAGGQGDMKGKLIRAAHYSDWDFEDMKNILRAFAEALGCTSAEYIETADKIYNSHTGEK